MSKPTITRRDLGGVATGAGLLAAASGMIVEAPAQTASKTFMLIHGAWHGGLRPCCAGGSRSGRWSLAELPFSHGRALVRGRNVPEKSRLRCSDLCRLCVCRILVLVLGPRNSSRGGKLLTAKAPARSEAARAFFAVTPATAVPTPPRLRSESSMGMTDATAGIHRGAGERGDVAAGGPGAAGRQRIGVLIGDLT